MERAKRIRVTMSGGFSVRHLKLFLSSERITDLSRLVDCTCFLKYFEISLFKMIFEVVFKIILAFSAHLHKLAVSLPFRLHIHG